MYGEKVMFDEDNVIKRVEREFIGKTGIYEIDENGVWIYDWLSLGVYYLNIEKHNVEVVICPEEIHKDEVIPIVALKRNRDEIILIPDNFRFDWIIFHLKDRTIQKVRPINIDCKIDAAIKIDSNLYLIPWSTKQPIFIVDIKGYKLKFKKQNWFENREKKAYPCGGAILCNNSIIIPIQGTNCILKIENENMQLISLSFEVKILSAYQTDDEIWILPGSGYKIYQTDKKGVLKNSLKITENEFCISVTKFNRIIATEYGVFLFPLKGNDIYVYHKKRNIFQRVNSMSEKPVNSMSAPLFADSYWGYISYNNRLCLLPRRYRYAEIDMRNMSINYYSLKYGKSLSEEKYINWRNSAIKKKNQIYMESSRGMLEELLQYLRGNIYNNMRDYECNVGDNIYKFCNVEYQ